jgi:hypothetical protein
MFFKKKNRFDINTSCPCGATFKATKDMPWLNEKFDEWLTIHTCMHLAPSPSASPSPSPTACCELESEECSEVDEPE